MLIFLTIVIIYPVTYIYQKYQAAYHKYIHYKRQFLVICNSNDNSKMDPVNDLSVLASSVAVLEGCATILALK